MLHCIPAGAVVQPDKPSQLCRKQTTAASLQRTLGKFTLPAPLTESRLRNSQMDIQSALLSQKMTTCLSRRDRHLGLPCRATSPSKLPPSSSCGR